MSKLLIPIAEIEEDTTFEFKALQPKELQLVTKRRESFKHIDAVVKLSKSTTGITAHFDVNFVAELSCVRCLEIYTNDNHATLYIDYIEGKAPHAKIERVELQAIDVDREYYTGHQIDISIGIREAIILSLPVVPLCKDGCLGLCPVCGGNLNKHKCRCTSKKVGAFTPHSMNIKISSTTQKNKKRKRKRKM